LAAKRAQKKNQKGKGKYQKAKGRRRGTDPSQEIFSFSRIFLFNAPQTGNCQTVKPGGSSRKGGRQMLGCLPKGESMIHV